LGKVLKPESIKDISNEAIEYPKLLNISLEISIKTLSEATIEAINMNLKPNNCMC
jgi:hypothetical protein